MAAPATPRLEQLELRFDPQVCIDMRVDRLADGRLLLSHSREVELWGSTAQAAGQLGKSRRWVQEALAAGLLQGERIGKNWRVNMLHLQQLRKSKRNF
jgi:hypothetical protein